MPLRSAVGEPDAVLCDEGLSSLDPKEVGAWFFRRAIWTQRKVPTICVSHDVDTAILLASEVLLMSKTGGPFSNDLGILFLDPFDKDVNRSEHVALRKEIIDFLFEQGRLGTRQVRGRNNLWN